MIDKAFRKRGVEKLYTWATDDTQYRYNIFLGFVPTGEEVILTGYDKPIYEFEKVL